MTQTVPMFDPYTGDPLKPRFDPYTGLALSGVSTVQAEDAIVVHPTANGGLHDGSLADLLARVTELEAWRSDFENDDDMSLPTLGDTNAPVLPDLTKQSSYPPANVGTVDTPSIAATGGVTGNEPTPSLLDTASVPTNGNADLAVPSGAPVLADNRPGNQASIPTTGEAFTPAPEVQ